MITFIVTTYNLEDWLLRRCLDSIVQQGLARDEYEIIVVDDESAISPQHVVDEFVERVDITLYVQKHARQGAARNLGLHYAKGKWIQFVDGDDYLFAGTVPVVVGMAEANNLDLLLFGFRKVSDREKIGLDNIGWVRGNKLSKVDTGNNYMRTHNLYGSCWHILFCRDLCDKKGSLPLLRFTENIYIEDEEFVSKLVWRAQRVAATNVEVYAYYQRQESTIRCSSREHTNELFYDRFVVLRQLLDFKSYLEGNPHDGLTRKIRFLVVDVLRLSLQEANWKERWIWSACQLQSLGLYPVPAAGYSWKYRVFRILTQCRIGRCVLRIIEKNRRK